METKGLASVLAPILLGLAIIACGSTAGFRPTVVLSDRTPTGTVIVASDGQSQITVPDDWRQINTLNDKAEIQAGNNSKNVYIIVLTENKEDFTGFQKYSELALSSNFITGLESPDVKGPTNVTINGKSALQYEILAVVDGLKVAYLYTLVEGEKNYHQIIVWTVQSKFDANESLFQRVTQSFQELSK
jgi:hypothetical protein